MVWVGRDLKDHLIPIPLPWAGTLPPDQGAQTPSNLALNTAREWASTASLDNLHQCLTTLILKNFCLIPNLNVPPSV